MRHPHPRPIKILEKKLLREKAEGQAYKTDRKIEIDPRLRNRCRLEALTHELLHILFPKKSEYQVRKCAREIADRLWEDGYRRIYH